jgi:hypothetical protein
LPFVFGCLIELRLLGRDQQFEHEQTVPPRVQIIG